MQAHINRLLSDGGLIARVEVIRAAGPMSFSVAGDLSQQLWLVGTVARRIEKSLGLKADVIDELEIQLMLSFRRAMRGFFTERFDVGPPSAPVARLVVVRDTLPIGQWLPAGKGLIAHAEVATGDGNEYFAMTGDRGGHLDLVGKVARQIETRLGLERLALREDEIQDRLEFDRLISRFFMEPYDVVRGDFLKAQFVVVPNTPVELGARPGSGAVPLAQPSAGAPSPGGARLHVPHRAL